MNNGTMPMGAYSQPQQFAPFNTYNTPNAGIPKQQVTCVLTPEEIEELRKQPVNSLDMKISRQDLLRSKCAHKYENGTSAAVPNPNSKDPDAVVCAVCGTEYTRYMGSREELEKAIDTVINSMDTVKETWGNIPASMLENYFNIKYLLKDKLLAMYDNSTNYAINFGNQYSSNYGADVARMGTGYMAANPFQVYDQMRFAGYQQQAPQGYYMNPNMQPQQQVPVQQGYYYTPNGQMMVDPSANPLAYGVPQQAPVQAMPTQAPAVNIPNPQSYPVQQAPAVAPQVATAPAAEAAPAASGGEVVQTQQFGV